MSKKSVNHCPSRGAWLVAGLLASIFYMLTIHGAVTDSQTFDEGVHLSAGVSYWRTGDFRLNPEHPILWKLVAALPVLLTRPTAPLEDSSWAAYREWDFASVFMHQNRVPTTTLLFLGRLPTTLAGAGIILLLFWLGQRLFSTTAGLVAASLATFDPTLIAHSHLITTDVPVTLLILLTIAQFVRFVHAPSRRSMTFLVGAYLLAILVKYSALYLLVLLPITTAILRRRYPALPSGRKLFGWLVLSTVVTLFVVYGFRFQPMAADPRISEIFSIRHDLVVQGQVSAQPALIRRLIKYTDQGQPLRRAIDAFGRVPLPFYWYLRGAAAVVSHAYWGQHAYLLGHTSERGWSWYFPLAFLVKTPAVSLTLILLSLGWLGSSWFRWRRLSTSLILVLAPIILYGVATMTSRLNLGIRHLLPVYPFLYLLVGAWWADTTKRRTWRKRALFAVAVIALPVSVLRTHPHEIAYFSELVGGERQGARYLLDSNLDWGQDLVRLRNAMQRHRIDVVALGYSGTANPRDYGIRFISLPTDANPAARPYVGWVALSIGQRMGAPAAYRWLEQFKPLERVGSTIDLYYISSPSPSLTDESSPGILQ